MRIGYFNANLRSGQDGVTRIVYKMIGPKRISETFPYRLILEFLSSGEDQLENLKPISDKEFYSILAFLVAGVVILALTIGPLAIV